MVLSCKWRSCCLTETICAVNFLAILSGKLSWICQSWHRHDFDAISFLYAFSQMTCFSFLGLIILQVTISFAYRTITSHQMKKKKNSNKGLQRLLLPHECFFFFWQWDAFVSVLFTVSFFLSWNCNCTVLYCGLKKSLSFI